VRIGCLRRRRWRWQWRDKNLVGKCICEYADAALLPNAGDSRVLHRVHAFVGASSQTSVSGSR